ncbi:SRPBCC family protein, partial [Saccharomonospora saliphila]|uniref:SRPBCC family protein n=1 Tax=Saccharomonospora saliphila TaxID=369829 RepID=UPI0003623E06
MVPAAAREHAEVDIVGQLTATYRALSHASAPDGDPGRADSGDEPGGARVVLRRRFPGELDAVFTAISDPAHLRRWFGPVSGCRRARGGREFVVGDGPGGRLLRREPSRLLEFTERATSSAAREALVTVRLAPDGAERTIVELTRDTDAPRPGTDTGGDDPSRA